MFTYSYYYTPTPNIFTKGEGRGLGCVLFLFPSKMGSIYKGNNLLIEEQAPLKTSSEKGGKNKSSAVTSPKL